MPFSISVETIGGSFNGPYVAKMMPAIRAKIKRIMREEANLHKRILLRAVSTWDEQPLFEIESEENEDKIFYSIFTDDRIFYFIDKGTRIRFATMTRDFSPKSVPNSLVARPGSGGLAYVNPRRPRRGIEPRNFMITVYEKRRPIYVSKLVRETTKIMDRYWKG